MKKILFLSAIDFKEKSIQVIRKTPEFYAEFGWEVDYVVARDNLENGNYFYEGEVNPRGVNVYRCYWPFPKVRARCGRYLGILLSKFSSFIVILKLFLIARSLLKQKEYDVIYGYEFQGVLAMNLLKFLLKKDVKTVSRFQGTFLHEMIVKKQYLRIIFNFDLVLAIWLDSDLLIMTNDGTQGNLAVKKIKRNKQYNMVFWVNGVDKIPDFKQPPFNSDGKVVFMSISRLVIWKRVDRNIRIMKAIKDAGFSSFIYYVIGDGDQRPRLEKMVKDFGLQEHIFFLGALNHKDVIWHLSFADFFLSMYDSSNIGNPVLEAIRANKAIVTLDNGDTGDWIKHKYNGLIYKDNYLDFDIVANDILSLIYDPIKKRRILDNLKITESEKLWTWAERLTEEIRLVEKL